jgi:hypothetical protein
MATLLMPGQAASRLGEFSFGLAESFIDLGILPYLFMESG